MSLPSRCGSFDAVTVAFGLRNMPNYRRRCRRWRGCCAPPGASSAWKRRRFQAQVLRAIFAWYFDHVVPFVGGLLSGDRMRTSICPRPRRRFPDAVTLGRMMLEAGFSGVRYLRLGLGQWRCTWRPSQVSSSRTAERLRDHAAMSRV